MHSSSSSSSSSESPSLSSQSSKVAAHDSANPRMEPPLMSDLKLPLSRLSSGSELQITSSREKLLEELRDARGVDQAFEEKMDKVSEIERHILEQATPGFTPCKFSHDEVVRLKRLYDYEILDSEPEEGFDSLARLASSLCGTAIACVSLVDADRQWFKSEVGLGVRETGRAEAFCPHAFATPTDVFEVPDTSKDDRFRNNPLVTGGPEIGFYAGAPLLSVDGFPLGTLCVIDKQARNGLSPEQRQILQILAKQVTSQLELRRALLSVERAKASADSLLSNILPPSVAKRLLNTSRVYDEIPSCTCAFVDICGFTTWSATRDPNTVIERLDLLFSRWDRICLQNGTCKIKTMGDGYFFASGVPEPLQDHAVRATLCALQFLDELKEFNERHSESFSVRVGLCSGRAFAGVVGTTRMAYDLWGATVNEASRCETNGMVNAITVSDTTRKLLERDPRFRCYGERTVLLKGIGLRRLSCVKLVNQAITESSHEGE